MVLPLLQKLRFLHLSNSCQLRIIISALQTLVFKSCSLTAALRCSNKHCKPLAVGWRKNYILGINLNVQSIDSQSRSKGLFRYSSQNKVCIKGKKERRQDSSLPETFSDNPFRRKLFIVTHQDLAPTKNTTNIFQKGQRKSRIC